MIGKTGEIIASAITNLDLHDIARVSKTYGIKEYFVVCPLEDQRSLVKKLVSHWTTGPGARYNPLRRQAMELIRLVVDLNEAIDQITISENLSPKLIATCAKKHPNSVSYHAMRKMLNTGHPYLILFGTAWGLAPQLFERVDYVLEPIRPNSDYNHLSVRSAVSIILDRLIAGEKDN